MAKTPEILLSGLSFPEGPRWHDGKLWFSDFYTFRVLTVDLDGRETTICDAPQRPSGLGWRPDGTLLVVSMVDRRLMRLEGGTLKLVAELDGLATGHCNDMVVDREGRAYVGNFGYDSHNNAPPRLTRIIRVDPDGSARAVGDEVFFPNGMVITPDGKRLIVGETRANRLSVFDIAADGALGNRRLFAEIPNCLPDGICLDAEGAIWVTDAGGKRALRVFEGGRIAETISTGEQGCYACMLGGEDGRTLFLCTSSGSGPKMAEKRDGRIEFTRVEVPHAGLP